MKGNYIKYLLLCFLQLALLSCVKETPENPAVESANTILYSVTVSQSPLTRVALSGSEFADGCHYVFESGDKLYVEYRDAGTLKLYGVLTLISGAGTGTGRFEGELKCLDDFVPEDNTLLNATVVGANAAEGFFNFGNPTNDPAVDPGSIVTGVTYPSSVSYAPLPEMVQKYSYFTGTSTYDAKNFNNLTQQSVFLLFKLANFRRNGLADKVNLLLKNGTSTLHTVTEVPIGKSSYYGNVNCSTAVQAGDVLAGAKIQLDDNLEDSNVPMEFEQGLSNVLNLEANHYYSVSRILDSFRIKATVSGTTMTFRYTDGSIEYSEDKGETWYTYTGKTFNLSAGDEVWFRGNRTDCNCKGSYQLFTADQVCYIAGDITSLIGYKSTLPTNAFRSAFSYGDLSDTDAEGKEKNLPFSPGTVDWVDIDPNDPLILPASTAAYCYMEMFSGCTNLKSAPDLLATVLEDKCYLRMFLNCSKLKSIPTFASDVTMSGTSSRRRYCFQMFQGCIGINRLDGSLFEETTELKANCFEDMFANCTGLTSVSAGFLPSTRLAAHCYRGMFQNTAITSAPDLLAGKLYSNCYRYMFNACKSLEYIKCYSTTNVTNDSYTQNWLQNAKSTGTFHYRDGTTWYRNNLHGIPNGWTPVADPVQ